MVVVRLPPSTGKGETWILGAPRSFSHRRDGAETDAEEEVQYDEEIDYDVRSRIGGGLCAGSN